ncbi:thiamine-phosphate kinase [Gaopeijia maritima]|uniref:thiamine-phosphate kinase n=1 Tax=Gaopeijia maritima TaxID=3119007 RepID=UPI00324B6161
MSAAALGPGAEFDLIRRLTDGLVAPAGVTVGTGDDGACLEGGWVISTDLTLEDVHFRRSWCGPEEWGGRAVRAALSDLAAMAARPVAILLSLAGSADDRASGVLQAVGQGARAAAESLGAAVIGGDVTRSPARVAIDVVVLGRTDDPLLRRGARPGDDLWVTGHLGGAGAAVRMLLDGRRPPPPLEARFARPQPRLAEALWLADTGHLTAGLDLSDGLAGDATHLAAASEVGLEIDESALPVDPHAVEAFGASTALRLALSGGEDYELLLAADPALAAHREGFGDCFPGVPLTRIGRVVAGSGVSLRAPDGERRPAPSAFDHFPDSGSPPS